MKTKKTGVGAVLSAALAVATLAVATLALSCGGGSAEPVSMYHWDFAWSAGSPIAARIAERTGVVVDPISAPWSEWPAKLNAMMAAGDMPDVFITYGPGDVDVFRRLRDEGAILGLSKYLPDYPNIAALLARWPDQAKGGEFHALPVETRLDHAFMIRADRLDALGLSVPGTVDDFLEVARALKARYGGYPISSSPAHTAGFFWLYPIFYAYGGAWDDWVEEEGRLIPAWISAGNREALRFIAGLYGEGLLDPEFFSNSDADKQEKFLSGKASIVMEGNYPAYVEGLAKRDPAARIAAFGTLEGPGGRGMWGMDNFFTAVSINARLPEAKIRKILGFFEFLYSDEGLELLRYGVEGTHWKNEDGRRVPLLPVAGGTVEPLARVDPSASLRYFVEFDAVHYPEWTPRRAELAAIADEALRYGRFNRYQYDPTEADAAYSKILYDLVLRHYVEIVSSADFDGAWDSFRAAFLAEGGAKVIEERNKRP